MQHVVDDLILVPTLHCSQTCAHCCRAAGPWRRERMSKQVADHLAYWLDQFSISNVTISGGEPLLMSDELWRRVCHALPSGLDGIYIVSNGDFLDEVRTQRRALRAIASLQRLLANRPDMGLGISLSDDQYHTGYDKRAWRWFQDAVANPWEWADGEDDPIYGIDAETVNFSMHGTGHIMHVIPTGRGRNESGGEPDTYEDCGITNLDADDMGEDAYCAHQLTVYPDGKLKACCNGGPTIGTIYEDGEVVLQRHLDFVLTMRRRYGHAPDDVATSVPTTACRLCAQVAREVYPPKEA